LANLKKQTATPHNTMFVIIKASEFQVSNIHAYLHEVVGALQQILKAFLVSNIGEYHHHYSSVL
jgi:hypothetical protein